MITNIIKMLPDMNAVFDTSAQLRFFAEELRNEIESEILSVESTEVSEDSEIMVKITARILGGVSNLFKLDEELADIWANFSGFQNFQAREAARFSDATIFTFLTKGYGGGLVSGQIIIHGEKYLELSQEYEKKNHGLTSSS